MTTSDSEWQRVIQQKYLSDQFFRCWWFSLFFINKYPIINTSSSLDPSFFSSSHRRFSVTYSSSYNLTPAISRVLIGEQLIFCSPPWPTCCNSPRKCTPVKYKTRQKVGFPIITYKTSQEKAFLEISQNSQENNCVGVSFLIKLPTKKKRNSGAGAFQWILWNSKNTFFTEHLWASVSVFLSSFSQLALLNEIPTLYFTRKCDTYLWSSGIWLRLKILISSIGLIYSHENKLIS